ncbi:hypothetical protein PG997_010528 [Apiospora hydei]|uniref:Uncharacterized protein n=1 Tax=Apiospora hydei TaxID=1337664 RepID=A0ABR1VX88_9PEZI
MSCEVPLQIAKLFLEGFDLRLEERDGSNPAFPLAVQKRFGRTRAKLDDISVNIDQGQLHFLCLKPFFVPVDYAQVLANLNEELKDGSLIVDEPLAHGQHVSDTAEDHAGGRINGVEGIGKGPTHVDKLYQGCYPSAHPERLAFLHLIANKVADSVDIFLQATFREFS